MRQFRIKKEGITLIALVITIIILLILVGVTIATLGGENGLLEKTKLAKNKYEIAESKEKLELAIMDLRIDEERKGETLTKEDLPKMNNDEIDVKSTDNFPVEVICQSYQFSIDENFTVTYVGKANETVVTYTTEPKGYTNKDEVKILVKISNPNGIKSIQKPGETDKILPQGQTEVGIDFTVTKNGIYSFKITDNENKETVKDVVIDNIDKVKPKEFSISAKNIMVENFTIVVNVEDGDATEESSKSGIGKYEYYIKEDNSSTYNKYESTEKEYIIKGLTKGEEYNVYVIAYDKAGNYTTSSIINVTTYTNPQPPIARISFNEENATEKVLDYPVLTLDGVKNCILEPNVGENVTLEITSPKVNNMKYYYSLDGGNNWNEYINKISTKYQADNLIQVKSAYIRDDEEIYSLNNNIKKYVYNSLKKVTMQDALAPEAYDNDFQTFHTYMSTHKYFKISPDCWGKYITIYFSCDNGSGFINFGSSYANINDIKSGWIGDLSGVNGTNLCARSILIPEGSYWSAISTGASLVTINVYEVWISDEDLSGNVYSNDNRP